MKNSEKPAFAGHNTPHKGLTKREYFAGLAMQGLLAFYGDGQDLAVTAKEAKECADALLNQLQATEDGECEST